MLKTILKKVASANGQDKWKILTKELPELVGEIYIDVFENSRPLTVSIIDKYISKKRFVRKEKWLTDKIVDSLAVNETPRIDLEEIPAGYRLIVRMLAENYTFAQIGKRIGVSDATVCRKIGALCELLRREECPN